MEQTAPAQIQGLVPELLEKLKYLMQRYGETLLCKTIAGIAGKVDLFFKNDCTRFISLNEKDVC